MKRLTTYSVIAVLSIMAATATAATNSHSNFAQVSGLRSNIHWQIKRTHYFQDLAGISRTPTRNRADHTRSVPFLRWIRNKWSVLRVHAKHAARKPTLTYTNDWLTAVRIVQRVWPGSAAWLKSCSKGEGGWGRFVMNYQGSGAGGWMQYMSGTFYSHLQGALAQARKMHRAIPPKVAQYWKSPLGQAFAAGWARLFTNYHQPWDPSIDPRCE